MATHVGTHQHDTLIGTDADELLSDLEGLDRLDGGKGDDVLVGGPGGDALFGGDGDDTYVYNLGDDGDIIQDAGGSHDVIRFGTGIDTESLIITERPSLLHVVVGDFSKSDQFLITDWGVSDNFIEEFVFENGVRLNVAEIERRIQGNRRPKFLEQTHDQVAIVGRSYQLQIPEDSVRDPEGGRLQVLAQSEGSRLLLDGWLKFDDENWTFRGTPGAEDIGDTEIILIVRDSGALTSKMTFNLRVARQ